MRRNVLFGIAMVLAIAFLCSAVPFGDDSDADPTPNVCLKLNETTVGQIETYGWSAIVDYSSNEYSLVIVADTGTEYEWKKGTETVSNQKVYNIKLDELGDVTYSAYLNSVPMGEVRISVLPRPLDITVKNQTITYGATISSTDSDVKMTNLDSGDHWEDVVLSADIDVPGNGNIDLVSIVIKDSNGNVVNDKYMMSITRGGLTINNRAIDITVKDQTITYGDNISSQPDDLQISGLVTGHYASEVILAAASMEYSSDPIRLYLVSMTIRDGNDNIVTSYYDRNVTDGELTVNKKLLTVDVNDQTITYGDNISSVPSDVDVSGLLTGQVVSNVVLSVTSLEAGVRPISLSSITIKESSAPDAKDVTDNYDIEYEEGYLEVYPRAVTIKARDQTGDDAVIYGNPLGTEISITSGELVLGHTVNDVVMSSASTDVGEGIEIIPTSVQIIDSEGNDVTVNYQITFAYGLLDIVPRPVTYEIHDGTETQYDGTTTRKFEFSTGVGIETLFIVLNFSSELPGTYEYSFGEYSIGWEKGTGKLSNYDPSCTETGDVKITKRLVTISAKDQFNVTYGNSISETVDDVYVSNLVSGHRLAGIILTPSIRNVGTGVIVPSAAIIFDSDDFEVTQYYDAHYMNGTLTIVKRELTITAVSQGIVYGNPVSNEVTTDGLADGDVLSDITIYQSITHVGTGTVRPYDAVIKKELDDVTDNYKITYVGNTLTISKRPMLWMVPSQEFIYDGICEKTINVDTGVPGEYLTRALIFWNPADVGTYQYGTYAQAGHYTLGLWGDGTGYRSDYEISTTGGAKEDMTIKVAPTDISIEGEFTYDGTSERTLICETGVNSETIKIKITFTSKNVGDYDFGALVSGYTLGSWQDDTGKVSNYDITRTEDTLTISKKIISIIDLIVGPIYYDSVTDTADSYIDGIDGETLKAVCTTSSPLCGKYTYWNGVDTQPTLYYTMTDWQGYNGSDPDNYTVDIMYRSDLYIIQKVITIVAKDQVTGLEYGDDINRGTDWIIDPSTYILPGHSLKSVVLTPSSLQAGDGIITPSDILIEDGEGNNVTSNYDPEYINGALHINKRAVTCEIPETEIEYNGSTVNTVLFFTGYDLETLAIKLNLSSADVGTYKHGQIIDYYTLGGWDETKGTGKVSNYDVTFGSYGDFTVEKRDVVMKIPQCKYTYNGKSEWTEDVECLNTGSVTEYFTLKLRTSSSNVGTYMYAWETDNYQYEWQDGTGDMSNYNIVSTETDNGIIIVALDAVVRAQSSKMYDGSVLVYVLTEDNVSGLVKGDKFISGTAKTKLSDCATYSDATVSIVTQNGGNNYNFKQELELTIYQRDITVTSATASAVEGMFIGSFRCEDISSVGGSGYAEGQTFDYIFTGSQILVGSSPNYFTCTDSATAILSNYKITYVYGNLKVISKSNVVTKAETDSDVLSEQMQADLLAAAQYYKSIGAVRTIEVITSADNITMSADFVRQTTIDCLSPMSVSTYYGRILLTKEFSSASLTDASQLNVKIAGAEKTSGSYALEYEILLTADGKEIHKLGISTPITFFIDPSKVFPVNRTMKIVAVATGEKYDASYDGQTGEISFETDHLSLYAVTMEENVGGPSFTGVIIVLIVTLVLAAVAGVVIYYLKRNYYI